MTFSHDQLTNIPTVLSAPRFATYLQHCGNDRQKALALYQWNLELSSAFIVPLHVFEISARNAVVDVLDRVHTLNWPWNQGFIATLPNPSPPTYSPRKNLEQVAAREQTTGKVVAELKFVFWEKMFTHRHDKVLWNNHIRSVFPHAPAALSVIDLRARIYSDISVVRGLRNRIAHHEPIFSRNVQDDYDRMFQLISWRDTVTADWMNGFQGVASLIRERPTLRDDQR